MNHKCLKEIKKDFEGTLKESHRVTKKDTKVFPDSEDNISFLPPTLAINVPSK